MNMKGFSVFGKLMQITVLILVLQAIVSLFSLQVMAEPSFKLAAASCHVDDEVLSTSLPLSSGCWETHSPWGGSARMQSTGGNIRFYGSGSRQGTQAFFANSFDLRRATVYLKWRPHGSISNDYAAWGVGVGQVPDHKDGSPIIGLAATGWTKPRRGAGFTTDSSFKGSKVLQSDTWYYTRLVISADKAVIAVTATGSYDDSGGTYFYGTSHSITDEQYNRLVNASVFATFHDNDGGAQSWMEIGEVKLFRACTNFCLDVTTEKTEVTMSWTSLPEASGYTLYYALPDEFGEIDAATIGSIEMGMQTSLTVDLPSGFASHVAIMAHISDDVKFSNIEYFMSIGGDSIQPETGTVLLEMRDPGDLGTITLKGSETQKGPSLPLKSLVINSNTQGTATVLFNNDGKISSIARGSNHIEIEYGTNGDYEYLLYNDGSLIFHGKKIHNLNHSLSLASFFKNNVYNTMQIADPVSVKCNLNKKDYKAYIKEHDSELIEIEGAMTLSVGLVAKYLAIAEQLEQSQSKCYKELSNLRARKNDIERINDKEKRCARLFALYYAWKSGSFKEGLNRLIVDLSRDYDNVVAQRMAKYDEQCAYMPEGLTCPEGAPIWIKKDLNSLKDLFGYRTLGKKGYANTNLTYHFLVNDKFGLTVNIQYKEKRAKAYSTFKALLEQRQTYKSEYITREIKRIPELEEYEDEEVYIYSYTQHYYENNTYQGTHKSHTILAYSGNVYIEVDDYSDIEPGHGKNRWYLYNNTPLNMLYDAYRQAKNLLIKKCYSHP